MKSHETTHVQGIIKSYHQNPKGDVDGLTLEDGREVRFPPHHGREVSAFVAPGDEVECKGHDHVDPKGRSHVHADSITQVSSGRALALDGPPPPKGHAPPPGGPHPGPPPPPPGGPHPGHHPPHHEQMLAEIRAIRAALGGGEDEATRSHHPGPPGPPYEQVLHALRSLRAQVEQGRPS